MLFEQGFISADKKTGLVTWNKSDEETIRFKDIKSMAESQTLIWYSDTLFLWLFPIELLKAFDEVHILTFMFCGSHLKYYLDMHGVKYTYNYIKSSM